MQTARHIQNKRPRAGLPLAAVLVPLALMAFFALFLWGTLSGRWPAAHSKTPQNPEVVVLDDAWAEALLQTGSQSAMQAYLADTLDAAAAYGSGQTAVAFTARAPGGAALFPGGEDAPETAPELAAMNGRFTRADVVQQLVKAAAKRNMPVYLLATDDAGALLAADEWNALPEWENTLAQKHGLILLALQSDAGGPALYAQKQGGGCLARADGNPALLAAVMQTAPDGTVAGAVLGDYSRLGEREAEIMLYHTYLSSDALPDLSAVLGSEVAQKLAVTYPTQNGSTVSGTSLFLMGTSNPAQPLLLNAAEVPRYGTQGVWGILVSLAEGENTFVLQNGDAHLTYTVNAPAISSGTAQPPAASPTPDDTLGEEAIGRRLQITDDIASVLTDPAQSGSISETLYKGAAACITGVKSYTSGKKVTHAYQLSMGGYVRAAACRITENTGKAEFTDAAYLADAGENCASLTFSGGTPAVFHTWENNTLTLTFIDSSFPALPEGLESWAHCESENRGDDAVLTLSFPADDPLYGWAVNYDTEADTTTIWLKHAPHLSSADTGPLTGVTVMLDPGHGGDAAGAMGAGGKTAPEEKQLNLAVALAAKYRLEQLGATVVMTREEDSGPTLGDRVTAMNTQHPDLFISIHHNSVELETDVNRSTGTEAYWFYSQGQPLADALTYRVGAAASRLDRGSAYGYYYVTRSNVCPAVLLEIGFVTNPAEYEACASTPGIWAEGGAIAEAVQDTVAAGS